VLCAGKGEGGCEREKSPLSLSGPPVAMLVVSENAPKPYLVLRDTLRSCEAYGMRPVF
jgi:hypothetical protein